MAEAVWDVFVSYARRDAAAVWPLVDALRARGLRVFVDDATVADFASISATIHDELSRSRVLLAYYSTRYPRRRACQWELTAAFVTGQREGDPRRRVLVVNPEPGVEHVHPIELRDARHLDVGSGRVDDDLADRVAAHVAGIDSAMGEVVPPLPPAWTPAPARAGSPRFVGRPGELWQVHSALHPHSVPLLTGRDVTGWATVHGAAGIGKTLLVEEYALRFGAAYPGGIYWLHVGGSGVRAAEVADRYRERLATVAGALDIDACRLDLDDLLNRLSSRLGGRGQPFLWVVDDLPDGLDGDLVQRLRAPHPLGCTVFTSRSGRYAAGGAGIALPALDPESALHLLRAKRTGAAATRGDDRSARRLVEEAGRHPLALDLLGSDPTGRSYRELSRLLHHPGHDVLGELSAGALLPTGYPTDVAGALLRDVRDGDAAALDVLRIGTACDPSPLTGALATDVLARADTLDLATVESRASVGLARLARLAVVHRQPMGGWAVRAMFAWALHHGDPDPERAELLRKFTLVVLAGDRRATIDPGEPSSVGSPTGAVATREVGMTAPRVPGDVGELDRTAAFELQLELVTRVGVQRLGDGEGILREALASLRSLLDTSRGIVRRYGIALAEPRAGERSEVERIIDELVNDVLRPFLSRWHPALAAHEASRPQDVGAYEHEQVWPLATDFRAALDALHDPLVRIARELGEISGSGFGLRLDDPR